MSAVSPFLPGTLAWSAQTDRGRVRQNNEDSFLALTFDGREVRYLGKTGQASLAGADFVFAVSDGMGGAKSGEFASKITVARITRLLPSSFKFAAQGLDRGFNDVLEELFASIHREMLKLGNSYEELSGMGATLSLAWFTPGWCYFGHLGDSRIYHLPAAGGITQVTHDHTYVGWLRRGGKLNEREARSHPGRNSLNQALGAQHQFVEPHIGAVGADDQLARGLRILGRPDAGRCQQRQGFIKNASLGQGQRRRRRAGPGDQFGLGLRREAVEVGLAGRRRQLQHLHPVTTVCDIGEQRGVGRTHDHILAVGILERLAPVGFRLLRILHINDHQAVLAGSDILDIDVVDRAGQGGGAGGSGAGGGGFMLFWVPLQNKEKFQLKFDTLLKVPFRVNEEGSTTIYKSINI